MGLDLGLDDAIGGVLTGGIYPIVNQGTKLASGKTIGQHVTGNSGGFTGALGDAVGGVLSDYTNLGSTGYWNTPYQVDTFQSQPIYFGGSPQAAHALAQNGLNAFGSALGNSQAAFDAMMTGPASVGSTATANATMGQASFGDAQYGDAYFGDLSLAAENQALADREAAARYGDQSGSLQLAREAAMGMTPSEAQILLGAGLDQALANQQALAGGARGNAAVALAQGNAQANAAALQNQSYLQSAALRAQEMANARSLYGGLAEQQRAQDLSRLGLSNTMALQNAQFGNQMSLANAQQAQNASFANAGFANDMSALNARLATDTSNANAGLATNAAMQNARMMNDVAMQNANMQNQYKLGVGNVGAAYGNMGIGYLNQANDIYGQSLAADKFNQSQAADNYYRAADIGARSYDTANSLNTQIATGNAKNEAGQVNNLIATGTDLLKTIGGVAAGRK